MVEIQNVYDDKVFFDYYKELRESKINANELIEIPQIKEMLPDLKDKTILDLGCGDGSMSRYFIECGAKKVVAIDVSTNMIKEAKKHKTPNITYKVMSMEEIDSIKGKFDIVYSSLAFHYVEDYLKLITDISNKLKKGGYLVYSQEHPIVTCLKRPKDNSKYVEIDGKKYYLVTDYNNIGKREVNWTVDCVIKYHRNFETIINTLIGANLQIEKIGESKASAEAIKLKPKYANQNDRPFFLYVKAKKIK